jgi:DNA-binding beta-propeller fold protein YncE
MIDRRHVARFRCLLTLVAIVACGLTMDAQQDQASFEINLPGPPFGVVASRDQEWIFVSFSKGSHGESPGIAVLRNREHHIEIVRTIPMARSPLGLVLTHDGDMLIAAADDFVVFFDTKRLESGEKNPAFQWVSDGRKAGSIYASVTADDKTLFVSDEWVKTITVIDLGRIRSFGRDSVANLTRVNSQDGASSAVIGKIPVGISPVALTFSNDPDQRWLFATSEVAPPDWGWPRVLEPEGGKPGQKKVPEGAVILIDVAKAKVSPEDSVVARVPAGGSPVRLALSPDGGLLFVTARNSNAVLVFNTAALIENPGDARPTKIPVGSNPVPVILVDDGKLALIGNSNRYSSDAANNSTLTVLDTSRIGTDINPNIGSVRCGAFPRNFYLAADGRTLFLTNFRSSTLQVIDVSRLLTILEK